MKKLNVFVIIPEEYIEIYIYILFVNVIYKSMCASVFCRKYQKISLVTVII